MQEDNIKEGEEVEFDPNVKVGGDDREFEQLPIEDDDGVPIYYRVKINSWTPRRGRLDDNGNPTIFLSWEFEVTEGDYAGHRIWGTTNTEARRSYKDDKPLRLLQLILAVNKGVEPEAGKNIDLSKCIGREIRVRLENNERGDRIYQNAVDFKPVKKVEKKDGSPKGMSKEEIEEEIEKGEGKKKKEYMTDKEIEELTKDLPKGTVVDDVSDEEMKEINKEMDDDIPPL